jgi:hypothetical protein
MLIASSGVVHFTYGKVLMIPTPGSSQLTSNERKIATMHAAGATNAAIGHLMEMSAENVGAILGRTHVAHFCMLLHAIVSDSIAPGIRDVSKAIEERADRAFQLECKQMEALDALADRDDLHPSVEVKARLGVVTTAADILDRAGKRAPTKVINTNISGKIPQAAMDQLTEVLKEFKPALDVTPNGGSNE